MTRAQPSVMRSCFTRAIPFVVAAFSISCGGKVEPQSLIFEPSGKADDAGKAQGRKGANQPSSQGLTVKRIVRQSTDPVHVSQQVEFEVEFSANVSGVSVKNFSITDSKGTAGSGVIESVECSENSASCIVAVRAISPGNIRLDLSSTAGILGSNGLELEGSRKGDETYRVGGWQQEAYVKAANANAGDEFGWSVSLSGDTLAVGATREASNQTTITNGSTASAANSLAGSGAVYVYRRSGTQWAQEAYVKAANADASDRFGTSVSLSGDTLAAAAVREASNQTTITNGSTASADNSANEAGAVYVYRRSGTQWAQEAYVKAAKVTTVNYGFARTTISLSGDTLAVGADGDRSNQTTITNGSTASADNTSISSGAVYVYRRNGTQWTQEAYVKAANANESDRFGTSVSLSGDTLAAAAVREASNQTTITNGSTASADNSLASSGAVYVYRRSGTQWAQEAYVKAANADASDGFGWSVSLSGDTLAVGASDEASNQTTITNGSTASADNSLASSGAVYVYRRSGTQWAQEAYVKAANADASDGFGGSVSLSGDTLAVGAIGEDSNQTTITNGSTASADNSSRSSGAVYVYRWVVPE